MTNYYRIYLKMTKIRQTIEVVSVQSPLNLWRHNFILKLNIFNFML